MINFNFKVNKRMLARVLLERSSKVTIRYEDILMDFKKRHLSTFQKFVDVKLSQTASSEYNEMLRELYGKPLFIGEYVRAKRNMQYIKKDYYDNIDFINNYFKNTLKIDPTIDVTAYIMSPELEIGLAHSGYENNGINRVFWGHTSGAVNSNIDISSLLHEAMHCVYPYNENASDFPYTPGSKALTHSLIEIATDGELFTQMDKISGYVTNETEFNGHNHTRQHKEIILPYWFMFLGLNNEEIKHRLNGYDLSYTPTKKPNFKNATFDDFYNWCHTNIFTLKQDYDKQIEKRNSLELKTA